ncbi:MAG: hypothetical protein ACRD1K_00415 [Acidimicrobiales bacterium]
MVALAPLVVMVPLLVLVILLMVRLRQQWSSSGVGDLPAPGADGNGVREPRRPLVPAGSVSAMAPEPEPETEVQEVDAGSRVWMHGHGGPRGWSRAS